MAQCLSGESEQCNDDCRTHATITVSAVLLLRSRGTTADGGKMLHWWRWRTTTRNNEGHLAMCLTRSAAYNAVASIYAPTTSLLSSSSAPWSAATHCGSRVRWHAGCWPWTTPCFRWRHLHADVAQREALLLPVTWVQHIKISVAMYLVLKQNFSYLNKRWFA
jgi:hypothetical protein